MTSSKLVILSEAKDLTSVRFTDHRSLITSVSAPRPPLARVAESGTEGTAGVE